VSHAIVDPAPRSAKLAKKNSLAVQSSEVPHDGGNSRVQALLRPALKSPRQLKIHSARETSDRFQRMNELWGSPDGLGSSAPHSPLSGNLSGDSHVTRVKKHVGNHERVRADSNFQAENIRTMMSPQTPTFPTASFIPHVTSPSVALHVLQAAHANMTSAISNSSFPSKTFKEKAGTLTTSRNKMPNGAAAVGFPGAGKHGRAASAPVLPRSPSMSDVIKAPSFSPSAPKAALLVSPSYDSDRPRESVSHKRIGEEILSSEEQELKV
jgi:hypothetical protein